MSESREPAAMTDVADESWGSRIAPICLPLILAPPIVMIGPYGITLPEAIVLVGGLMFMLGGRRPSPRIPAVILIYFTTYLLGWVGAIYNGFDFGITFVPSQISLVYTFALGLCGFIAGRYSRGGIEEIMTSRFTKWIVLGVGIIAVTYPFLSPATRARVLAPFIYESFMQRLNSPRFPGMGINANVYSFMVYVFFLFTTTAFLAKRVTVFVPLAALLIVLAAASRTVTALVLSSAAMIVLASIGPEWLRRARGVFGRQRSRRRALLIVGTVFAIGIPAVIIYGEQIAKVFTLYERIQDLLSGNPQSSLSSREELWALGLARVHLSPVLGIPMDVTRPEMDTNPLYYYTPHNEFLFFWSVFGLLGVLAHVFLVGAMLWMNIRARTGIVWLLFYGGMIMQMTFDAVFQGPRNVAFFFIVIGLNMRFIAERTRARAAKDPDPASPMRTLAQAT